MCLASVVFLNFGAEPQSTVGSIQELRTDYSNMKKKVGHVNIELDRKHCGKRRNCSV